MTTKRQISFKLDEGMIEEYEHLREVTGLPISRLIELKLKGYSIVKDQ